MDPKMDSGMILDSDLNKPPFNLHARLKPKEVLGIIDHLFNCEVIEFSYLFYIYIILLQNFLNQLYSMY
jgi:hypothetical protein